MKNKMMIYHAMATGLMLAGVTENVWGHEMLTATIDASDKEAVAQAKAEDWHDNPQAVIDELEGETLQAENTKLKNNLADKKRIAELEQQIADKDEQIKALQDQLNAQTPPADDKAEKPTAEPEKPVEKPTKSAKTA